MLAPTPPIPFAIRLSLHAAMLAVLTVVASAQWQLAEGALRAATSAAPTGDASAARAKLVASDGAADDIFGYSTALSGDTAVVGARLDDDNGTDSGAAYVFVRTGSTWTEQAKLTAADGTSGDQFGWAVAIDGDTAVVGAVTDDALGTYAGLPDRAYLFRKSGTGWQQETILHETRLPGFPAQNWDGFGRCAIDGDTALVADAHYDYGTAMNSAYPFTLQPVCQPDLGFQGPGAAVATLCGTGLNAGESSGYGITGAPGSASGALFISFDGFANLPFAGGTLVSFLGYAGSFPISATAGGTFHTTFGGLPVAVDLVFQSAFVDLSLPELLAFTNAIKAQFGQ